MADNELNYFTKPSEVFTYKQAKEYTKYRNSKPTVNQLCWRDIKTGGTVVFNGV
jgi:hypothetical protein